MPNTTEIEWVSMQTCWENGLPGGPMPKQRFDMLMRERQERELALDFRPRLIEKATAQYMRDPANHHLPLANFVDAELSMSTPRMEPLSDLEKRKLNENGEL